MTSSVSSTTSSATSSATSTTRAASSLTSALFQASGIASGLNTSTIVDSLIAVESGPLNRLRQRQSDYQVQISTAATLVTQLKALQTEASKLASNGVAAIRPSSTFLDFEVTGSAKVESTYAISVQQVAKEAKLRMEDGLSSAQDASVVPDGELRFSIDGTNTIAIDTTGKTLADVAEAINQNISSLNASVISTDDGYYLTVARRDTGYSGAEASNALTVVSDPGLGLGVLQTAEKARLTIDGLSVERNSNTITDVVPGATLRLMGESGVTNQVKFAADSSGTEAALETFVKAYNELATTVRSQLVTDPEVAYGDTLLGHSSMATIQSAMQRMLSQTVVGNGSVRILADLGLELQQDGTLYLNPYTLDKAVTNNPGGVNAVFSTATTGIAAIVKSLVDRQTSPLTGTLVVQQRSLQSQISDMDERATQMQANLDAQRQRLVAQFTAMEQLIAGFNSAGTYLTQIANLKISST